MDIIISTTFFFKISVLLSLVGMQPGSRPFPHLCALLLRTFIKFLPYERVLLQMSNTDVYNETLREELKFKNLFF
jgi:hypothetical protein